MNPVDTAPTVVEQWPEPPRLLVEWSSPWEEFKTALSPALSRSPKPLAGEARTGIFPYRGMLVCWVLECLLLVAVIVLPGKIASLQPYQPPPQPKWDVIYYSGDELPHTQDRGGAEAGTSGRAGGQEAYHRTQTIRVARGDRPSEKVVDAPKLDLPKSDSSVANLLAFRPLAGPPPAEGLRSRLTVPELENAGVVAPAPELNSAASRRPEELQSKIIAPPPDLSRATTRNAPAVGTTVVAPAPNIANDKVRGVGTMTQTIIAPPPTDAQRDLASSRSPLTQTADVVAPPVSAPTRVTSTAGKLSLPAPAVIAPPPSQVSRDLNSWGGSATGNIRTSPVPPPPSTAGSGSSLSRAGVGTLTSQVVPPPPTAAGGGSSSRGAVGTMGTQVVPPPVASASLGSGEKAGGRSGGSLLGSANVVPPPPTVGGGKALSGSGRGNKGNGAGGPFDLGSVAAPPTSRGGNAPGAGVVMSTQPGTRVGVPNATGGGAIAMSPSGTAKTGIGGNGGGTGIGSGNGPGSGMKGEGPGAGREGSGRGSDPNARGGISPYPGSGGAGSGTTGAPALPGVSVQGGTTTIVLPSFSGPGENSPPTGPGHSSVKGHRATGVVIVATSRSGGVFNYYGLLKGRVYSIYMQTSLGSAVMEYSDPESAVHPYADDLVAPDPMRTDLPPGLRPTHVVFVGILDRTGVFRNLKVLEPGAEDTTSSLLVALRHWKFRPAFHGEEPVEVTVIFGFGVDTR
jgi:hypothetical protein